MNVILQNTEDPLRLVFELQTTISLSDCRCTIFIQNGVDILRYYGAGTHCKKSMSVYNNTEALTN